MSSHVSIGSKDFSDIDINDDEISNDVIILYIYNQIPLLNGTDEEKSVNPKLELPSIGEKCDRITNNLKKIDEEIDDGAISEDSNILYIEMLSLG